MKDTRIGKFTIDQYVINERPHHVLALMKDMIIVRAEYMWAHHGIEYMGIHPDFAALPPGQVAPEYVPIISTRGDGSVDKVKWSAACR